MSRWVSVDDTDSNIRYSGSDWVLENGKSWDTQGNFGATYKGSLHMTSASDASFSYAFDGSNGAIFGTNNIKTTNGVQDPTWECLIDGVNVPISSIFPYTENQWTFCSWDSIQAGSHTITVRVKSKGQAFLFDRFSYLPTPGVNVQNADISVSFTDSALDYGSGWGGLGTIARMAPAAGAVVNFPFYGTGITWMGVTPKELPQDPSTATYSFDGRAATTFTLPGKPGTNTQYNQRIFSAGGLPLGQHTLTVTSRGANSQTPLVLAGLIIENGATVPPVASPPPGNNPLPPNTPTNSTTSIPTTKTTSTTVGGPLLLPTDLPVDPGGKSGSNGGNGTTIDNPGTSGNSNGSAGNSGATGESRNATPIGAIVGGAIGGLALIVLIILAMLCYRKRNRRKEHFSEYIKPFNTSAAPINYHDDTRSDSGSYAPQQMAHAGNSQGVYTKQASANQNQSQDRAISGYPNTIPSFYPNPSTPFTPGRSSYYPSAPSSEASVPSSNGSSAPLIHANRLQPNRGLSKYQESLTESSQPTSSRDVFHEDSGIRMRPNPPPTVIVEHPPMYTPA
ncbi:hypothetical protein B0H34DRAFT_399017 [Crassisporium funariophilum]|nr:hypothetical protein B0H34DRAFT_399017 [Crassisporium funariophilum]